MGKKQPGEDRVPLGMQPGGGGAREQKQAGPGGNGEEW